jgi:stress response protein SCP2
VSISLTPGMNAPLTGSGPYTVTVTHQAGPEVDLTAFLMGADVRVRSDADMVFYNQPNGDGAQYLPKQTAGNITTHQLSVNPANWPADIERVRIGLTVDDTTFGSVANLQAIVSDASGTTVASFDLSARSEEDAFIVGDIYRRGSALKVRCEAAGFTNGLAGLATDAGVKIEEEAPAAVKEAAVNFVKQLAEKPLPANASPVDLRNKSLAVVLVRNSLDGKIFRVVLMIDSSGSMDKLFVERGSGGWGRRSSQPSIVQCTLERMIPVADLLDDNHAMETWFFGTYPVRTETATPDNVEGFIQRNWHDKQAASWSNDEVAVMHQVIQWVKDNPSPYPTIVLGWSDGGVGNEKGIKKVLVESSSLPICWVWLGLGRANYGVLARLDAITGGVVDNCGFFEIDDIEHMSDDDLYSAIFAIVTKWHKEAKAAGVISASH